MKVRSLSRMPDLAVLCLLVAAAIGTGRGFWAYSYDDAFITYRYAWNWSEGNGLVFNPGEAVLGTTAPGYALLLGGLSTATGISVPGLGTVLALISLLVCAVVLRLAAAEARAELRYGLPLLLGVTALALQWNIEMFGAEQFPILAAGMTGAWLALARSQPVLGGLLIALAMVFRLDAGLLGLAVGLVLIWRDRLVPWRFAAAGLGAIGPFLIYLQRSFGTIVPNTLSGKQSELTAASYGYTLAQWSWLRRGLPLISSLVLLGLAALGLALAVRALKRAPKLDSGPFWLALAGWVVLHETGYRIIGVPFAPWYHLALLNAAVLLAGYGALCLSRRSLRRATPALVTAVAGALLLPIWIPSWSYVQAAWRQPPDPRYGGYVAAGRSVLELAGPGATVAAVEIGFFGYTSQGRILDLVGLVSPAALEARRQGRLAQWVADSKPEFILDATLFRDSYLQAVLDHPDVAASYSLAGEWPDGRHPDLRVRLLRRVRAGRNLSPQQ
jgi:hypothetical protein